jgi:hypothetical protein
VHTIRDLASDALDANGRLRILPAAFWADTTVEERASFARRYGFYSFPTTELVDRLREIIDGRRAIEIGAGNGVLAEALGIIATDSRMQETPVIQLYYTKLGQATVPYGPNVVSCPASQAVRQFQPEVVLGCWITHKYDPKRHAEGGSVFGVDEMDVLRHCQQYVQVGNEFVHAAKVIWDLPHKIEYPPYVYSRAINGSRDYLATWRGLGREKRQGRVGQRGAR